MSSYLPPDTGAGPAPQGPDLSALLGQPGMGAAPPQIQQPPDQPDQQQVDPLSALQDAIHALTAAMVALPEPQDVQDAAQALTILARVQTRTMKGASGPPQG